MISIIYIFSYKLLLSCYIIKQLTDHAMNSQWIFKK